jgi:hypothetical protein
MPQQQILKFSASQIGEFLLQVTDTNGINIIMSPFDFSVTTGVELAFSIYGYKVYLNVKAHKEVSQCICEATEYTLIMPPKNKRHLKPTNL